MTDGARRWTRRGLFGALAASGLVPPARAGGVLQVVIGREPASLIPGFDDHPTSLLIGGKIFEGLLCPAPDGNHLPGLARAWTVSDDGMQAAFALAPDAVWHDGAPFTSEDVVFSLARFLPTLSPRRPLFAAIAEVAAPDPASVVIRLASKRPGLLSQLGVLTAPILPKHLLDAPDLAATAAASLPVGTGPFRLLDWRRGEAIRLARFNSFRRAGLPHLDGIGFNIVPDAASRAIALGTGSAALVWGGDLAPQDLPRLAALPSLAAAGQGGDYLAPLVWMALNHRVAPLGDVRLRQAMLRAIDRTAIIDGLWQGYASPAAPLGAALPDYDPRAAAALLDAAGLAPDGQGIRCRLRHLVPPGGETAYRLAAYLRRELAMVGIELTLEAAGATGWARRIADWDYETSVALAFCGPDPLFGLAAAVAGDNVRHLPLANTGGYANAAMDAALSTALAGGAPDEFARLLVTELPQLWLFTPRMPDLYDARLTGLAADAAGVFGDFAEVSQP